jgi:hypothetical protein
LVYITPSPPISQLNKVRAVPEKMADLEAKRDSPYEEQTWIPAFGLVEKGLQTKMALRIDLYQFSQVTAIPTEPTASCGRPPVFTGMT